MQKQRIYSRDDLIQKFNLSHSLIHEWESLKLLRPVGKSEEGPFYTDQNVTQIEHIQKFLDMGYQISDIEKIIKKVGMPSNSLNDDEQTGTYLTVGNLAEQVGVSPRTIKHWEDKGIVEPDMRSEGGFRLYSNVYIYFCHLIQDLQLFGYSLDDIKQISDYFRDFLAMQKGLELFSPDSAEKKLNEMLTAIDALFQKTELFKEGIQRWEDLLKRKKKEIQGLKAQIKKQIQTNEKGLKK